MDNFIVSARKYRPITFASVIGQSHITSTLKNAISRGQLAHAYLFCGPRGVGKTTCARIFAKAINCLNPTADAEACNECESCRGFNESRSFNIHELDAASNNSVDDIRSLIDQVRIPPQVGRYSVYIIDEVHMLSLQAFNAFLKTLEEPPAHAVFILATTEKHKIIPTILSRCQIYDFNRIRVEDGVQYLKYIASQEGVTYDDESLHIIAQKADGGMRDALSMFDKVVSFCGQNLSIREVAETLNVLDYDTYFTVTEKILAGNYTDALLQFDEVLRKGFSGATFIAGLNNHFRDLLMCKNPQTLPLLEVTGSVAERYKSQAASCGVPLLFEGINLLTAVDAGLRTATNQRLHVELGLMKLCGLGQKKNSDDLTAALPPLTGRQPSDPTSTAQDDPAPVQPTAAQPAPATAAAPAAPLSAPAPVHPAPPSTQPTPALSAESAPAQAVPVGAPALSDQSVSPQPLPSAESTPAPSAPVAAPTLSATHTAATEAAAPHPAAATPHNATPRSGMPALSGGILSGRSIGSILSQQPAKSEAPEEEADEELAEIDEDTETALVAACERFAKELMKERPRMGVLFEDAHVSGNCIALNVPNESSYDELMNNLAEMKQRLGELGDLRTTIEFNVTIKADTKGLKPIKVEDRMRYLSEKNPLLAQLRKELELDVE